MPEQLTPAQAQIEESRRQLRAALEHGVTASPEAEASLQREARQRDMTPDTLRSIRSQGVALPPALGDWYGLPETHPSTARTLSRPGVAGVAHDDIPALQSVEGAIRNIPSIGANRNTRFNFGSFLGGIRTAFVEGAQQSVKGAQLQLGDLLNTTAPFGRDVYGNAIGGFTPANRATVQGDYQASSERLTQATPEIANPVLSGAYSGLQSLAQTAPGLALSIVTRNPAFALGSVGVQVETQAYGKYTGRGASMGEATLGAVGEGSVEVVTELLPMGTLVKGFGKDALGKFLKDYVVREGVGEQIATLAQDAIDTAIANPDKTWGEYFRERPNAALQTAVATFVQTGVIGGSSALARRADQFVQTRAQVDNAATTIESIIKTSEASKLRVRDPQTFEQLVADAAEGGPVENVYIDANVFAQTLQASGTTVEEVAQAVPAVAEQIGQAMADGGDIRIPVEQFAAHMATADYGQALADHLRVDPSLPSRAEVSALSADQGAALQDEATRILTAEATTTEFQASAERVRDSFVEQLNTAGRFTKDVNTAYASLVSKIYAAQASRLGITPEEMAARFPLLVASEAPGGKATTLSQEEERGSVFLHGSTRADLTLEGLQTDGRTDTKQGKKGKVFGGFYVTEEASEAERYSKSAEGTATIYEVELAPGAKILELERNGQVERLTPEQIAEWRAQGYAAVRGKNIIGTRTEVAVIDKNQVKRLAPQVASEAPGGKATLDQAPPDTVELIHYSGLPGLTVSDPARWGATRATQNGERNRRAAGAPGRTYFGVAGVYGGEMGVGIGTRPQMYRASIERSKLYDFDNDPLGLRPSSEGLTPEQATAYEQAIQQAGFAGYRSDAKIPGAVAVFEPLPLKEADKVFAQSATIRSGKETLAKYGLDPAKKHSTRAVAAALEARQRAKYGSISKTDRSDEAVKRIAGWMAEEVQFEMENPNSSGVGWYSTKFQAALDTFAQEFPELKEDQGARDLMTALIAITSDGQKVVPNFQQAAGIYRAFKRDGKFVADRGTQRQSSVDGNLAKVQELYDTLGPEGMRAALLEEMTVSELKKKAAALGVQFSSSYQANVRLPLAALVFGPKLGAFYANLMGADGYLTMDRWWSRTFNRYRGTLLQAPTAEGIARFRELIGEPGFTDDQVLAATVEPRNSYLAKNFKDGTEVEKAANTIYKAAFENLEDHPFNASDRSFMLKVVDQARKSLSRRGVKISVADIQAVLWYYEKRLYGELGARQTADISYEEAAQRVIQEGGVAPAGGPDLQDQDAPVGIDPGAEVFETDDRLAPLEGAPKSVKVGGERISVGPFATARQAAYDYMAARGLRYQPPTQYAKVDTERAGRLAQAFADMAHAPNDPQVRAAYSAMIEEALAQYQFVKATGLEIEFIEGADPYALSPRLATQDVIENNHLWVFPTDAGFGSDDTDISGNPLLDFVDEWIGDRRLRANDVFRIVHDYFGHVKDGTGFRADGEENAYQSHAAMFSPLARRAMATETRGQNSWVNYGPQGERNREASGAETVFAPQKIGLLPDWAVEEGFLGGAETGTVAGEQPASTFFQSQPAFYSALARAVAETQTKRASADQWKATIAKTAGVKKDEIEWSSVNEWLDGQVGPIDREALAAYLADGGVQLEEVVLGSVNPASGTAYSHTAVMGALRGAADRDAALLQLENDGTAYRVLQTRNPELFAEHEEDWAEVVVDAMWRAPEDLDGVAQFSGYKLPGADDTYREVLLTLPAIQGPSTHWDTDNVVAHARITTRQDATGAKVLFIEEVQSDWHQKGRDEGYERTPTAEEGEVAARAYNDALSALERAEEPYADAVRELVQTRISELEAVRGEAEAAGGSIAEVIADQINAQKDALVSLRQGADPTTILNRGSLALVRTPAVEAAAEPVTQARLAVREARIARDALYGGGIPDAPFRTSWSTLVMKRMIRYAVDTGHDKVAWINGNQQNGGQTGGDGTFFYERNLVNTTNDLLKKLGGRVEKIDLMQVPVERQKVANAQKLIAERADYIARLRAAPSEGADFDQARIEDIALAESDIARYTANAESVSRQENRLGIQNGFVITDQMRDVAAKGFPLFQENRGSITFGEDITQSPSVISLLRTADLSTFLHETGHFFLEVISHIANSADAPAEIVADMDAILNWFKPGLTLAEWNALPLEEKRPYHEQFARGFEAFLFEGRSPSAEMRGIFQRFSDWLRNVYKSLAALDVELTDEVRSVMGRMVASAEEIKDAEDAKAFGALYEAKPEGMTDDAWTEYQRAAAAATEDGMSTLSTRTARDMQWASNAKSRALKLLQRENAEQRKVVKAEVAAEVRAEPVYRARDFLRRGTDAEGNPVENAGKLDLATLKATYGEETTALWRGLRIGGKYGDAGENGLNPDAVAELFGFDSGDALVRALIRAEDPNAKINGLTDQRMLERFGDITDDKSLDRAANEAVANAARLRFVATEYAVAAQLTGSPRALAAAAKTYAAGIVNRLVLKRLKPAQFFAAQTRAAKAAEKAHGKGDVAEVAKQKRNQLVNLQAARYALDGQAQVNKSLNLFKRIISAKDDAIAKSYDMNLVNAARAILAQYGVGRVKNDPSAYLDALSRYEPTLYADIKPSVDRAKQDAKPVEELTLEEFRGMAETVRQLWTLARSIKTVEIDGQRRTLDAIREELGARLSELKPGQAPITADPTEFERDIRGFQGIRAALRRVESWVRGIDGGDTGPFRTYFWNPVSEAADAYRVEQARFVERYLEILKPIEGTLTAAKIAAPELGGFVFQGRQQLLHAILHTGNQSNLSKLLLGRAWGRQNADGSLDTSKWDGFVARMVAEGQITKADYDVAQQIWDLLDETKPAAQRAHLEMYGRYFSEVTADEIVTPFGTYRGGYVPALTDTFHVQDAAIRSEENALKESQSAMFPAASNGFTKSRVEDYNRELALDMRLLPMHLDKVLKFTHMGPVVRNAARILKGRAFSAQLQAFDPVAQTDLLLPWLQRAATQVVERPAEGWAGRATDKAFRTIRSRVGMQLMFANLSNTAQQLTGFSQLAARVKKRDLQHALWAHVRNPKASAGVAAEKSKFMASRTSSQVFEMRQAIDQLLLNPNTYEKAREFTKRHGYFTQSAFQNFVDIIGWHAAYNMATARGDAEKEAVRFADSVIRETQGSMAAEDVARFETGTAFHRLFTQFLGYSNMTANLNATEIQVVARGIGVKKGAGRLFYVYLTAFAIPALLADAIAQAFRGTLGDEDDDGYLDDFLGWFFGSQLRFGASMVPVVGQVASALAGGFTEKPFDDKISTNPTFSVLESSARVPSQVSKSIFEGESFDRRDIRDTMTLMGIVTGLPLGALGKPVGYQAGVMQGDIAPTSPLDYARGLATGTPSEDSKAN